jgi:hypothetical protein
MKTSKNRRSVLKHEFVQYIPSDLMDGTIYVSIQFATAVHNCCCGCGKEVVTPLSPADWTLSFDGESVSLDPSIGNWNYECQSHYWITRDRVRWAPKWSKQQIAKGRTRDRLAMDLEADGAASAMVDSASDPAESKGGSRKWRRLLSRWF